MSLQITLPYYLGIAADALWAVALFVPAVLSALTGGVEASFAHPDAPLRAIETVAGILMTGWTFLLVWAIQSPIERRFVALLTAVPVIAGLCATTASLMQGNPFLAWVVVKTLILMALFLRSFQLAERIAKEKSKQG